MPSLTKQQIIDKLGAHRPIGAADANRGLAVRWLATGSLVFLLPLGVYLLRNTNTFLADHTWPVAMGLTAVGLMGIFIGYQAASRRHAAERQWGLAALSKEECLEFGELTSGIPQIEQIVDHWLEVWVSSGISPRGRDLALLREMVVAWRAADASDMSSPSSTQGTSSGRHSSA